MRLMISVPFSGVCSVSNIVAAIHLTQVPGFKLTRETLACTQFGLGGSELSLLPGRTGPTGKPAGVMGIPRPLYVMPRAG